MKTAKHWLTSKTLWGIIVAIIGAVLTQHGIPNNIPANPDATTILNAVKQIHAAHGNVQSIINVVLTFGGALYAFYGRCVAKTTLSNNPAADNAKTS